MIDFELDNLRTIGSTNTQTRRLGYVVQICKLLEDNYAPLQVLQSRIEDWSEENNYNLNNYINDKGKISRSVQSYGAKRYIELASDLQIITSVSGYFRPTIIGKLLIHLDENKDNNPFKLSDKVSCLLFYQLLLQDADYLLEILHQTSLIHDVNQLMGLFRDTILHRLSLMETMIVSPYERANVYERHQSILNWQKPIKYSEHIVLPRIHWLVDLRILDWNTLYALKSFEPGKSGSIMVSQLPIIAGHLFINRSWCQDKLLSVWSNGLNIETQPWESLPVEQRLSTIKEYVSEGFNKFSPKTHHRVSAYQLILYIMIRLLFDRKILIEFETVKRELNKFSREGNLRWGFFWSPADNDGFLIMHKNS